MTWDPEQYLAFGDLRLRPALELLRRIPNERAGLVVDLGCGAGNVTPYLARRWPDAEVIAVDSSAQMLERARSDHPELDVRWVQDDAATWEPPRPPDVLYSNSLLHWLDDHEQLVPRLAGLVRSGGTLAFQVPDNWAEPCHTLAYEVARDPRWADRLVPILREQPLLAVDRYVELLEPLSDHLDVWRTTYQQPLQGEDPVVEFVKGSLLRPLYAQLDDDETEAFESAYRAKVRSAYAPTEHGTTWYPFHRLFVVVTLA